MPSEPPARHILERKVCQVEMVLVERRFTEHDIATIKWIYPQDVKEVFKPGNYRLVMYPSGMTTLYATFYDPIDYRQTGSEVRAFDNLDQVWSYIDAHFGSYLRMKMKAEIRSWSYLIEDMKANLDSLKRI